MDITDAAVVNAVIRRPSKNKAVAWSTVAGIAAFGSTLAVSTLTQQRILGISTGSPTPLPTLTGIASVCLASLASHYSAIAVSTYLTTGRKPSITRIWEHHHQNTTLFGGYREDYLDLSFIRIPLHTVRICCLGLLAFKLLGGRYWAIAPSSYTNVGSFARSRSSLSATHRYATASERALVEKMGRQTGCHTCGSRMLFRTASNKNGGGAFNKFVGDHMPPKAVAEQMNRQLHRRLFGRKVSYRFFPQCCDCSAVQGSILSKAAMQMRNKTAKFHRSSSPIKHLSGSGGGARAYFHGCRPRLNHLAGGVLGAAAVVGAKEGDLVDGNRWRYARMHRDIDRSIRQTLYKLRKHTNNT